MQELKFVYPSKKPISQGTIRFIQKNYQQMKRLNPRLPILVRTYDDSTPQLVARYDYGGIANRDLSNLNEDDIMEKLRELQEIGAVALKADVYPWQEGSLQDKDIIDYNKNDPTQHHL